MNLVRFLFPRTLQQMGYDYHFGLNQEGDIKPPHRKDPNYDKWDIGYRRALKEDLFDIKPRSVVLTSYGY